MGTQNMDPALMEKYNRETFMYVEYPHKSFWSPCHNDDNIKRVLAELCLDSIQPPTLLYVHMPYCHTQCYFCTCHVEISLEYEKVKKYLAILHKEIELYRQFFNRIGQSLNFKEIHLGGGSPTYIREPEFDELLSRLGSIVAMDDLVEFSIEVDPRRVKEDRLRYYHSKGINRISFGVQDFDLEVQKAINRIQPAKLTDDLLTPEIRKLFPNGINFDIICGLPRQTLKSIRKTFEKVVELSPDRVCLNYLGMAPHYAPHQLLMPLSDLPTIYEKKLLFLAALDILVANGYVRTGYDHFAKSTDEVVRAMNTGNMTWNPLGVTAGRYHNTIGIGVHSYGQIGPYYCQNTYDLSEYQAKLEQETFPIFREHRLDQEDELRREVIQTLRSYFHISFSDIEKKFGINFKNHFERELLSLKEMVDDGLVIISNQDITITELGHQFANLVCEKFDAYLQSNQPE